MGISLLPVGFVASSWDSINEPSMIIILTIFLLSFSSPSSNNGGLGQGKVIDG